MKVYYAHSLHLYGTSQESRDVITLEKLGFEVYNPNNPEVQEMVKKAKQEDERYEKGFGIKPQYSYMERVFTGVVLQCDVLAFRAHIDGSIPAGVAKEIDIALEAGMEIIELPNLMMDKRRLSIKDTQIALQYLGQR